MKHPSYRVLETAVGAWQVYQLKEVNQDGSAEYLRWPIGDIVIFSSKEFADAKAKELMEENTDGQQGLQQ